MKEYLVKHQWLDHYLEGHYNNYFLAFSTEFKNEYLPASGTNDLICELLDTKTNITYKFRYYVSYEDDIFAINKEYQSIQCETLKPYTYEEHYCACNRWQDAIKAGLTEEFDNRPCEGDRFHIKSIQCEKLLGLILYSETYSHEELETML